MQTKVQQQTWTAYILNKHQDIPKAEQFESSDDCLRLELCLLGGFALPNIELTGVIDPYAVVHVAGFQRRTDAMPNTTNPEWNTTMVFPVVMQKQDEAILLSVEIWDENLTGNKKICSASIELPGMGRDDSLSLKDSATMLQQLMTVCLKTPSGGDGGILRYSARVTSFNHMERKLEALEVLAQVPLLPFVMQVVLRVRDEMIDLKSFVADQLAAKSLVQAAIALCWMPYQSAMALCKIPFNVAVRTARSVMLMLFSSAI